MNIEQLDGDVIAWGVKKGKSSNWSVWHKSFPLLQLPSLWATTETPKHNSKLFSQFLILNQKAFAEESLQIVIQQPKNYQIFHNLSWTKYCTVNVKQIDRSRCSGNINLWRLSSIDDQIINRSLPLPFLLWIWWKQSFDGTDRFVRSVPWQMGEAIANWLTIQCNPQKVCARICTWIYYCIMMLLIS